jgi:peptide/nickel transport system substrate-binding protein
MLRMKSVPIPGEADGSSEGETAESWEVSPDRLTITFKIRQGMVWDRRDPTNGRQIDADDVVFSWNKYKELNPNSAAIANTGAGSQSPVESVTATDAQTVVVKLVQPDASIIPMFSAYDLFYIQPKEADGGFDPRNDVRGAGMYILEEYVPSSHFTWARNPDFYIKGYPFPDTVQVPIVSDYAQQLAQFKSGNIYTDIFENVQEDVIVTKKDAPDTLLLQENNYPTTSTALTVFGWEESVPFLDVRVRQALSMMIDREAIIDVLDNRQNFEKEGLEPGIRRVSAVPGGWTGYWLDPTDEASFGKEAKYLNYNVEEAKALMEAAGYGDGLEFDIYQGPPGRYGAAYERQVELYDGMFRNAGQKPTLTPITNSDAWLSDYSRVYRTNTYKPGDGFNGIAVIPERGYVTVALQLYNQFNNKGGGYRGAVPAGGSVLDGDPKLNDLTSKISREFDTNAQIDLVHDLIRYTAENMYYIPRASSAKAFTLWWPAIGNAGAYAWYANSGVWVDRRREWWIDSTKAPLA